MEHRQCQSVNIRRELNPSSIFGKVIGWGWKDQEKTPKKLVKYKRERGRERERERVVHKNFFYKLSKQCWEIPEKEPTVKFACLKYILSI